MFVEGICLTPQRRCISEFLGRTANALDRSNDNGTELTIKTTLIACAIAASLGSFGAYAAGDRGGGHGGGHAGGGHGNWSGGGHGNWSGGGHGNWSGGGHGNWGGGGHGHGGWNGGGRWNGGWRGSHWHGGFRGFGGVYVGWPWYWWGPAYDAYPAYSYYGAPAYYDGAPAYYDSTEVYVEPPAGTAPATPRAQSQYYCPDAGYYPAVKTCPRGWLRVVPGGAPPPG